MLHPNCHSIDVHGWIVSTLTLHNDCFRWETSIEYFQDFLYASAQARYTGSIEHAGGYIHDGVDIVNCGAVCCTRS